MRSKFRQARKALPAKLRQTLAFLMGFTLILTGLLLVVLPGPFTMPLLILGLVVLALEFAWAETILIRLRRHGSKLNPRKFFKKKSS